MADLKWLLELDAKFNSLLGANAALGRMEKAMRGVGGVAKSAFGDLNGFAEKTLAHFTALASFEGIKRLGEGLIDLAEDTINTAAAAERTATAFKLLVGASEGGRLLDYIDEIAGKTEFTDDALKGMTQGLLKAGLAAKDIPRALQATLDMAALSGNGAEGAASAIGAFERIQQKGSVDSRVLRGAGIKEKDFYAQLAKDTGLGLKTVKDRAEKGKIAVSQVMESLYTVISGKTGMKLGGAGVEMGKGLEARLTHFKDIPDQFMQQLGKSPAMAKMSEFLGKLIGQLSPDSPMGSKLMNGIDSIFQSLVGFLGTVDIAGAGAAILGFFEKLPSYVDAASTTLGVFVTVAKGVWMFFDALGQTIGQTVAAVYLFVEALTNVGDQIGAFAGDLYVKAMTIGTSIWEGIKTGILGGITAVGEAIGSLGNSMVSNLKGLLGIHSPSSVFMALGAQTGAGFALGVENSGDRVDRAISGLGGSGTIDLTAPSAQLPQAGGGRGGAVTLNVPITVNVSGRDASDARGIATAIRDMIPGQLQAAFEQLALELGTA